MERVISPEERMRRAEEIYYKRREQGVRVTTTSVNLGKENKVSLKKKMIIQIVVCLFIYLAFWMIKGYDNVFSDNVINNTRAVLSYDINFMNVYNQCKEYLGKNFNSIIKNNEAVNGEENNYGNNENIVENEESRELNNEKNDEVKVEGNSEGENEGNDTEKVEGNSEEKNEGKDQESVEENVNGEINENKEGENTTNNGIGGGNETQQNSEHDGTQKAKLDSENKTQTEQDVEYIKQNYNIVNPIEGRITSSFGDREENEIISAFHQGIDIGAATGTVIHAAMKGTVIAASYAGDYGNHIKIQNGEVLTVYAHCSEINVNVGDSITQGQVIGKVGATGKVTGPHLHFEIRRDGRYINPELILSF